MNSYGSSIRAGLALRFWLVVGKILNRLGHRSRVLGLETWYYSTRPNPGGDSKEATMPPERRTRFDEATLIAYDDLGNAVAGLGAIYQECRDRNGGEPEEEARSEAEQAGEVDHYVAGVRAVSVYLRRCLNWGAPQAIVYDVIDRLPETVQADVYRETVEPSTA